MKKETSNGWVRFFALFCAAALTFAMVRIAYSNANKATVSTGSSAQSANSNSNSIGSNSSGSSNSGSSQSGSSSSSSSTGNISTGNAGDTANAAQGSSAGTDNQAIAASSNSGIPSTPAEILNKYSELMNAAKKAKVGYKVANYSEYPESERTITNGKLLANSLLSIMSSNVKNESDEKAASDWTTGIANGSDMSRFPLMTSSDVGCALTDPAGVKTATSKTNADSTVELVIVLVDEVNPEPITDGQTTVDSYTGGMFNPASSSMITSNMDKMGVSSVQYENRCHDCTSTLVYDPQTNHIVSLKQDFRSTIVTTGSIALTQEFYDTLEIKDLVY